MASGVYELLEPALVQRSLVGVYGLLPAGGRLVFTTQVRHPQLDLIANVLVNRHGEPWVMECRAAAAVEGWAAAAGFRPVATHLEANGLYAVSVVEKVAPAGGDSPRVD